MVNVKNAALQRAKRAAKKFQSNPTAENAADLVRKADYAMEKGWAPKANSAIGQTVARARQVQPRRFQDVIADLRQSKPGKRGKSAWEIRRKEEAAARPPAVIDPDQLRKGLKGMAEKWKCSKKLMKYIDNLDGTEIVIAYKKNRLIFEQIFEYETYYAGGGKSNPCMVMHAKLKELFQ